MNQEYYVYVCYVDGVVRYVGMGKGDRYKHCTSGTSSCPELNRDFFLGKEMSVEMIHTYLARNEAAFKEAEVIASYDFNSLYNKQKGKQKNLKGLDKLLDSWYNLTNRYEVLSITQVRRLLDKACFESDYCVKLYDYPHLDGWRGLPHKVANLLGLHPEIIGNKYCYKNDKLPFEQLQSNFRSVIK